MHFWANHFAVSVDKGPVAAYAGAFERDAIRPHVLGRFEDMLVAVERHPAMQLFLDQTRSVGPDSMAAMRAEERNPEQKRGLNENLAREIMELHTLGVRTGYTQADVTEFARALTGWSVAGLKGKQPGNAAPGAFVFRPGVHEPGARTIMGRTYDQPGEQQALAILHDFAGSPSTAQHIAGKLDPRQLGQLVSHESPIAGVESVSDKTDSPRPRLPRSKRLDERSRNLVLVQPAHDSADRDMIRSIRGVKRTDLDPQRQRLEGQCSPAIVDFKRVEIREDPRRRGMCRRRGS